MVGLVSLSFLDNTIEHLNRIEGDLDEKYDCRKRYANFYVENSEGEKATFRCGSWKCYCCATRMKMNLIREVRRLGKNKNLRRFLTLTLDPKKIPNGADKYEYIMERWNKFRIYLNREFGETSFVWVMELQENGNPHLHVLLSRYVPFEWIKRTWAGMGGGEFVNIQYADAHRVGNYMSKYLAKGSLMELPKEVNRYGFSSGSIDLKVRYRKQTDDETWELKVAVSWEWNGKVFHSRRVKRTDFVDPPDGSVCKLGPPS